MVLGFRVEGLGVQCVCVAAAGVELCFAHCPCSASLLLVEIILAGCLTVSGKQG